jgi:DNA-directed RNA polymerase specialized sigma24 family protein
MSTARRPRAVVAPPAVVAPTEPEPPRVDDPWPPGGQLPQLTQDQIRYRVESIARQFGLGEHDREDLTQDLTLRILTAMKGYNAALASRTHFARVVADLWLRAKTKRLWMECARQLATVSLNGDGFRPPEPEAPEFDADRSDRIAIATEILEGLPPELREFASLLSQNRPAEAAAILGVHRITAWRWMPRLRAEAEKILSDSDSNPCNKPR